MQTAQYLQKVTICRIKKCNKEIRKPLKSDSDDDVDGAAQGDVIERVESLGEEVSIDSTGLGKWPGKH